VSEYTPFSGNKRREPSAPVLIERLWSLRSAQSGKLLTCATFLHPGGIETRCSLGDDRNLLMSHVTKTTDEARAIAEDWKQAAVDKGFEEIQEKEGGER